MKKPKEAGAGVIFIIIILAIIAIAVVIDKSKNASDGSAPTSISERMYNAD